MGLCKCPKRKVTNLFCFEHRVNVCEHCLVSNHNKCIVQSYLQWLQDSDYNPNCALCNTPLTAQDTVRLVCYDVFHWSCLNNLATRLPLHTAPAGYQCPTCQGPVFPPSNLASPIADVLKEQLSSVNWARAGLGLPLVRHYCDEISSNDVTDYTDWSTFDGESSSLYFSKLQHVPFKQTTRYGHIKAPRSCSQLCSSLISLKRLCCVHTEHLTLDIFNVCFSAASSPRKIYDTRDVAHSSVTQIDFDDDKYRRRPALSWFAQILKNRTGGKRTSLSWKQRVFMLLLVGVLGFFTLIIIMAKLGRASAGSDPNLDPLLNPNIRVGKN
uniref:Zinc finger protein-like 1 n=1 Tax=Stegastes partitus TaxID=144197 RepID=A0A3B5BDY2_9TELE